MKNALSILALAAFPSLTDAQTPYHPMLTTGRTWDIFDTPTEMEVCPYTSAYHAFISGDTVLNNQTYKKIVCNPILSTIPFPFCGGFYIADTINQTNPWLLREDSAARKVYAFHHDLQTEYILFDFTLQVGDTLKYPWGQVWPVSEVSDFTLANGEVRRRFQGDGFPDNAYVESLGSLFGAFTPMYHPLEGWEITTCVRDSDELLYNNLEDCVNPQYTTEFAPVGAVWHYTQPILNFPVQYSYHSLTASDTSLNGQTWKVLKGGGDNPLCGLDLGYLRQVNDQVFFQEINGFSYLLYDFGLQIGDSYTVWALSNIPVEVKVDSIGATFVGGQALKTWFVTCDPPFWGSHILEKVGNLEYLIPLYGACDPLPGPIRCYTDNNDFFKWVTYPCDTTFTLDAYDVFDNQTFQIFPNPFDSQIQLELSEAASRPFLFEMYDLIGRAMFRQEIVAGTTSMLLTLPPLPPGLYFWAVDGRFGGRLVRE